MATGYKEDIGYFYDGRPDWLQGYVSYEDVYLLADMVAKDLSTPVIELGVASGFSSAFLLHQLAKNPPCDGVWLHSYDIFAECYFDKSRPTGAAVGEMVPQLKDHWQFHLGNGSHVAENHKNAPVEFAFIDADHRHPWACIDLVEILPALRSDAWVALHDINMPAIIEDKNLQYHGPHCLFDAWPWEKVVAEGTEKNIGAIHLPSDHKAVQELCAQVVKDNKWEVPVKADLMEKLGLPVVSQL